MAVEVTSFIQPLLLLMALLYACDGCKAAQCDGIDRNLSSQRAAVLKSEIGHQIRQPDIDILKSFRLEGWSIVYINTHHSDEAFFFYARDPSDSQPVTSWSGAATLDEEKSVQAWVLKNAPGIPARLAICFAWHVSQDRDR